MKILKCCRTISCNATEGMRKKIKLSLGPGIEVAEIELRDGRWVLSARAAGERSCPVCGRPSTSRHDWHHRRLQDLPVQGTPLVLDLRLGRWRCLNERCSRKTFVERLPSVAAPMARRQPATTGQRRRSASPCAGRGSADANRRDRHYSKASSDLSSFSPRNMTVASRPWRRFAPRASAPRPSSGKGTTGQPVPALSFVLEWRAPPSGSVRQHPARQPARQ